MAAAITLSQLYQTLRKNLGDNDTDVLVNFVDMKIKEQTELHMKTLPTKEDLKSIEVKLSETKVEIIRWVLCLLIPLVVGVIGLYMKK